MKEMKYSVDKTKKNKSEQIKPEDVAHHVAMKLYCMITNLLHRSREAVKMVFFEEAGYLGTSWSGHGVDVSQTTLRVRWQSTDRIQVNFEEI